MREVLNEVLEKAQGECPRPVPMAVWMSFGPNAIFAWAEGWRNSGKRSKIGCIASSGFNSQSFRTEVGAPLKHEQSDLGLWKPNSSIRSVIWYASLAVIPSSSPLVQFDLQAAAQEMKTEAAQKKATAVRQPKMNMKSS